MKRQNEMLNERHPADVDLDGWRTGLIDPESDGGRALRAHLDGCAVCRARGAVWDEARVTLESHRAEPAVRARRERALRGIGSRSRARPLALALAATLAALAIGLGVYFGYEREPEVSVMAQAQNDPDLYADLDFYLWLLERQGNEERPSG